MADASSKNTMERFEKVSKLCHYVTEAVIAVDDFEDELTPEIMNQANFEKKDVDDLSARLRDMQRKMHDFKDDMSKDIQKKLSAAGPVKAKAPPTFRPLTYAGPASTSAPKIGRTWQLDEDWKAAEASGEGGGWSLESKLLDQDD